MRDVEPAIVADISTFVDDDARLHRQLRGAADRQPDLSRAHRGHRPAAGRRRARAGRDRADAARLGRGARPAQVEPVLRLRELRLRHSDRHQSATASIATWCASPRCARASRSAARRSIACPTGPVRTDDRKVMPPPREELASSMEAVIHHFKLWTEGIRPPAGEAYVGVESPRGELGFYVVSDGSGRPIRVHERAPSFANLQALPAHHRGRRGGRRGGLHRQRSTRSWVRSTDDGANLLSDATRERIRALGGALSRSGARALLPALKLAQAEVGYLPSDVDRRGGRPGRRAAQRGLGARRRSTRCCTPSPKAARAWSSARSCPARCAAPTTGARPVSWPGHRARADHGRPVGDARMHERVLRRLPPRTHGARRTTTYYENLDEAATQRLLAELQAGAEDRGRANGDTRDGGRAA